mmetsp:Transcript_1737/g.4074  ORF Transcript_1737/g.4074 Transcript_1737/m.4074 type:complete len:796 (+) Transcript_1737:247-2634(+)|eukprot:CAMPEP_0171502244 /NCGR_PEP_ID=MMETSP0958-20121227/10057_1 /TAXON_ID=87120 /ORGANISM="Aurantiochytrium limacinum, Strain ATCCMYA-1381" /LENGTH=795 /DNA_ID=CAMNT_0012037251 /DNA_START=159 /DNA_END=2546 /DNA_ORIENTATION=+
MGNSKSSSSSSRGIHRGNSQRPASSLPRPSAAASSASNSATPSSSQPTTSAAPQGPYPGGAGRSAGQPPPVRCPRCRRLLQPPANHDRFLCPCGQMLMAPSAANNAASSTNGQSGGGAASSGTSSTSQYPGSGPSSIYGRNGGPPNAGQNQVQHVRCPTCNTTLAPPPGAPIFRCPCGTHLRAPNINTMQTSQRALVDPATGMNSRQSNGTLGGESEVQRKLQEHPEMAEMMATLVQRRGELQWLRQVDASGVNLVWKNLQSDEEEARKYKLEQQCMSEFASKIPDLTTKQLYEKLETMQISTEACESDEDLRETLLHAKETLLELPIEELQSRLDTLGVSYDDVNDPSELADRLITAVWYSGLYDDGYVREVLEDFSLDWIPAAKYKLDPSKPPRPVAASVLEHMSTQPFNDKLQWFKEHMKGMKTPWEDGHVQVKVRRRELLRDAFTNLNQLTPEHMRRHFRFEFLGEPGLDAGGVAREFFELVTDSIFNVDFGLFEYSGVDNICYSINPSSGIANELHMRYFYFLGRIMGKALFDGHIIPAHLTRPMYKHLLGFPITEADIEFVDPVVYKSMADIKECEDVEYLYLDFTTASRVFGETQMVELKPGGADIEVTNENREQYLHLLVKFILFDRLAPQLAMLLKGFYEVVPAHLISIFDYQELELLMCGLPNIDVDDWRENTMYRGAYQQKGDRHQVIQWFWEVMGEFSQEQRAKFLQFATGTSRVPVQGFSALQSSDGVLKLFTIDSIPQDKLFPRSHTCFNRIDLPIYPNKQTLKRYILQALSLEAVGFAEE